jgi:hypothetical protein
LPCYVAHTNADGHAKGLGAVGQEHAWQVVGRLFDTLDPEGVATTVARASLCRAPEVVAMPSPDDIARLGLRLEKIGHYSCKARFLAVLFACSLAA